MTNAADAARCATPAQSTWPKASDRKAAAMTSPAAVRTELRTGCRLIGVVDAACMPRAVRMRGRREHGRRREGCLTPSRRPAGSYGRVGGRLTSRCGRGRRDVNGRGRGARHDRGLGSRDRDGASPRCVYTTRVVSRCDRTSGPRTHRPVGPGRGTSGTSRLPRFATISGRLGTQLHGFVPAPFRLAWPRLPLPRSLLR